MTTNTAPVFPPSRRNPRQVVNTLKKTVNFGDTGIATGVAFQDSLPIGAFITSVIVEVVTAFNAASTNTLTVGTVSTGYNNMVASGDLPGNGSASLTVGATLVTRGMGRALTAAAEVTPYVKYVQTGTAASAGQAIVVITYEGGWSS
jgi:hypothetical protein